MSKTIDERVVEMRFDNAQFERNVSTSMSTLDRLKQSLNFSGVSDGLDNIGHKFSAFEQIATGALRRLGEQGFDYLNQKIQELTTKQIEAGWGKYADKTQAVQTIMAATAKEFTNAGEQMDYVSQQLDKLNWFTDETSYSFLDMVNNIGKFTSNNISLEQSVVAMQGISTWAAVSGANVNEAGRAMYNLSQAISVGAVKLMDWKSIENANMATAEFKQTAIETAVSLGLLTEKGEGVYETMKGNEVSVQNFNSALSDAWFTSEVLLKTLDQYGGFSVTLSDISDQTQLTASQLLEYLDAYREGTLDIEAVLEEVKEAGGDVNMTVEDLEESFKKLADPANELGEKAFRAAQEAKTFKEAVDSVKDAVSTGWMNTFELIFGNYEEARKLWTKLANELYDVFAEGGNLRNAMLEEWKELGGRDDLIEAFWNIFHAITGIIQAIKEAGSEVLTPFLDSVESGASWLKTLTERLKTFSEGLSLVDDETGELNEAGQKFKSTFKGVFAVLGLLKDIVVALIKPIGALFDGAGTGILDLTADIGEMLVQFREAVQESGVLEEVTSRLSGVFRALGDFIRSVVETIKGFISGGKGFSGVIEGIFDTVSNAIKLLFDSLSSLTGRDFSDIRDKITGFLDRVKNGVLNACGPLSDAFGKVKDVLLKAYDKIKEIFGSFGKIDTGGVGELTQKTDTAFKPLTALFEGVKKIFEALFEIGKKVFPVVSKVITFVGKTLSTIGEQATNIIRNADFGQLFDILKGILAVGIGVKITQVVSSFKELISGVTDAIGSISDTISSFKRGSDTVGTLLKLSVALGILAVALVAISSIDGNKMMDSMAGLTLVIGELIGAVALLGEVKNVTGFKESAFAMIEFAAAVLILASALKKIASLDPSSLAVGLVGLTVCIAELVIAAKLLSGDSVSTTSMTAGGNYISSSSTPEKMMKGAANALIFAAAISILASALKKIASLSWEELGRGLVGLTAVIAELVIAAMLLSGDKNMTGTASKAGASFTKSSPDAMMKGAANALIFAAAITVLAGALKKISALSWEELGRGLIGLTTIIAELVIAAKILSGESVAGGAVGKSGASFASSKPDTMMKGAANALIFSAAILVLAQAVKGLAALDWESLARGLTGLTVVLAEMVAATKIMEDSMSGSAAMVVAAAAILVLAAALKLVATMSWEDIAKGLASIAASFAIIGVAGVLLGPIIPSIIALAGAMALIGVAATLFGAGLLMVSAALAAFAGSTKVVVDVIIGVFERLITALPDMAAALAESLKNSLSSIIDLFVTIATAALSALSEVVPMAVDVVLDLIMTTLSAIAANIQPIVEALLDIVVGVIDGLAAGIPKIIASTVGLIKDIFSALADAIGGFDLATISEAIAAAALLDVLLVELAAMAAIAVVALVPLPVIGALLSEFIESAQPFLDAIQKVNPESLQGAKALAEMILILTANGILDALTSWFTGGIDFEKFGNDLSELADAVNAYAAKVQGKDFSSAITSTEALSKLIGIIGEIKDKSIFDFFSQGNKLKDFGSGLKQFGSDFFDYGESVKDAKFDKIAISSTALKKLIEAFDGIKNVGIFDYFTQGGKLKDFGAGLKIFGSDLAEYSSNVETTKFDKVIISATAVKKLLEAFTGISDTSIFDYFTQGGKLADFGAGLKKFGVDYVEYVNAVNGKEFGDVAISATALKKLLEAFGGIGDTSVFDYFTQGGKLADFGAGLKKFGVDYAEYVDAVSGKEFGDVAISATALKKLLEAFSGIGDTELLDYFTQGGKLIDFGNGLKEFAGYYVAYLDAVNGKEFGDVAVSATALKKLLETFSAISDTGWLDYFTQGGKLIDFGNGLKTFAPDYIAYVDAVTGKEFGDVIVSATALKNLINTLSEIDAQKIFDFQSFGGKIKDFATGLSELADPLVTYATAINAEGVDMNLVTESATAIQALVAVGNALQDSDVENWHELADLAIALSGFSEPFMTFATNVTGISEKVGEVAAAGNALSSIVNTIVNLPEYEGKTDGLTDFADAMAEFAPKIKSYCDNISQIKAGELSPVVQTLDDLVKMAISMSSVDPNAVSNFGTALVNLGTTGIEGLITAFTDGKFRVDEAVLNLISSMIEITNQKTSMVLASGRTLANKFVEGFHSKIGQAVAEVSNILNKMLSAIGREYQNFFNCGKNLAQNVANGASSSSAQSSMTSAGERLASALKSGLQNQNSIYQAKQGASSLVNAAENQLSSAESYNLFYNAGAYLAGAFAKGLSDNKAKTNQAASDLVNSAASAASGSAKPDTRGVAEALRRASDYFQNESDLEPRITPVLDLTNVRSGMNRLNSYMSRRTAMSVSSYMNGDYDSEIQNGSSGERGTAINFVQNNYSPKALSRIEIYRQTRNQLSMMKGLVRKR